MSIINEINKVAITNISVATVFTAKVELSDYVKVRSNSKVVWYKSTKHIGRNLFLEVATGKYWFAKVF